jgi:hypothetical protein
MRCIQMYIRFLSAVRLPKLGRILVKHLINIHILEKSRRLHCCENSDILKLV